MARLLKITYGSLTIGLGGNASITLTDKYKAGYTYDAFSITFEAVVRSATRSTFLTAEAALRDEFRKQDQDLDVELGGTNRHAFSASSNSGFLARATAEKVGGQEDTANSSRWRCSVTVQLPADLTGRDGRKNAFVSVDETPSSRKRVTITGEYTALNSNDALDQYTAAIGTWQSTVLSDLSGSYDLSANSYDYDDQTKKLRFRRVLTEIVYDQGVSSTDVAALRDPRLVVRRQTRSVDGFPGLNVRPLVNLFVQYDTGVDKATTTDLATLYSGTVRPRILQAVLSLSAAGSAAVVREEPSFDLTDNRISVSMDLQADAGGEFYQGRVVVEDRVSHGIVLLPVWSDDPFARDAYQGPAQHVKTVRRTVVGRAGATLEREGIPPLTGFIEVERLRSSDRFDIGIVGDSLSLEAVVDSFTYVRANVEGLQVEDKSSGVLRLGFTS